MGVKTGDARGPVCKVRHTVGPLGAPSRRSYRSPSLAPADLDEALRIAYDGVAGITPGAIPIPCRAGGGERGIDLGAPIGTPRGTA
jgi:hypothetical protein